LDVGNVNIYIYKNHDKLIQIPRAEVLIDKQLIEFVNQMSTKLRFSMELNERIEQTSSIFNQLVDNLQPTYEAHTEKIRFLEVNYPVMYQP